MITGRLTETLVPMPIDSHGSASSCFCRPDAAVEAKIGDLGREIVRRPRRTLHEEDIFRPDIFVDAKLGVNMERPSRACERNTYPLISSSSL